MPVSGAQQAWAQEMLQAAVHSMYIRDGCGETSRLRCGIGSFLPSGSFSAQSPQNLDPPWFRSCLRALARAPVQTDETVSVRASPKTRLPYGSEQPQTSRPSQSNISVDQGQEQVKRVAR